MSKVNAMPEILGVFLKNADALKADAASYIKDNSGIDLSSNEINIVENTGSTVHVALPYYAAIGDVPSSVNEADLEASGGNIVVDTIMEATNTAIAMSAVAATTAAVGVLGAVANAGPDNIPGAGGDTIDPETFAPNPNK